MKVGEEIRKILLIDDDRSSREPMAKILRLSGYIVVCAEDGFEAIEEMKTAQFDLILLDLMMPRMDGITFLRHLESQKKKDRSIVIVTTAGTDKEMIAQAKELGAVSCMIKSRFTIPELLLCIRRHIAPAAGIQPMAGGV